MGKSKLNLPQYISTTTKTVSIVGTIKKKSTDYIDGKGYLDKDGYAWIYCSQGQPRHADEYPYFWLNDKKEIEYSNPLDITKKAFHESRMQDMSVVNIIDTTEPNEQLYNEEEINDMNASSAFYVPIVNSKDDFLKKIVKNTIIKKKIDISRLKGKTDEKYILPNMKAALQNSTKMSVLYFCYWMDLLGCDFEITVTDNGSDKIDPLKNPVVYTSYTDKANELVNGELKQIVAEHTPQMEEADNADN